MEPENLKQWMELNNLTVADVASKTKLSVNTVYKFLRGEHVSRGSAELLRLLAVRKEKVAS
tara:strand:- start:916 stop:1098 length:183 start_codon:yes stop_codon:yes gene_type:complete